MLSTTFQVAAAAAAAAISRPALFEQWPISHVKRKAILELQM
jgi:hypothetical protein